MQVLLTLFALVGERFPPAGEEGEGEVPPDAASLAADLAFSSALAGLHERGLVEDEPTSQVVSLAAEHAQLCAALQEVQDAAGAARLAAQLQQRLAELDSHLAAGRYAQAAEVGVALEAAVQADPVSAAGDALQQVEARLGPLRGQLLAALGVLVAVDPSTHLPLAVGPDGGSGAAEPAGAPAAALQDVWAALSTLGLLSQGLQGLAALTLTQCVRPILAEQQQQQQDGSGPGQLPNTSPASSLASTTLSRMTVRGEGRSRVERQLYKLLKTLADQLLGSNAGERGWEACPWRWEACPWRWCYSWRCRCRCYPCCPCHRRAGGCVQRAGMPVPELRGSPAD